MSIEQIIAELLEAKLTPIRGEVSRLISSVENLRHSLPPSLVRVPEAARVLGVSASTIRRKVRDGSLPSRRVGHAVLIDLGSLHSMPEEQVIELAERARRG